MLHVSLCCVAEDGAAATLIRHPAIIVTVGVTVITVACADASGEVGACHPCCEMGIGTLLLMVMLLC